MSKRILLGIATLLVALLYACPADGGSTSSGPAPQLNIEEEITQKDPALVYKADMHKDAQTLFSRGDLDNPYLFSFGVTSVKNLEAITGEITIVSGDTVLYKETKGAVNPFEFDAHTDYQTYKTTEGMYTLDTNTFSGVASIDEITDNPSYDGTTYIVGIGPAEDKPIDFDTLTDDFSVHVKILYEEEVLKEETVQVSKAGRYDVTTWRDLQHISDDVTGDYDVKNNIVFPSVGAYGYENFRPIGIKPKGVITNNAFLYAFSGTFEGNNHNIEGLYIDYASMLIGDGVMGLFGLIKISGEIDPRGLIRNINIYHAGISGDVGTGAGVLIGQVRIQAPLTHGHIIVNNCHVYSLDGAVMRGGSGVGGLVGRIIAQGVSSSKPEIKDSSAHTDVEGKHYVGGLIGSSVGDVVVSNSYATGNVEGNDWVGGLVGIIDASIGIPSLPVVRGYATGDVTGQNSVGGIAGATDGGVALVGYATGKVEGNSDIGGVIGRAIWSGQWLHDESVGKAVINAYSLSDVVGEENVGGIIGFIRTDVASKNEGKDINIIKYTGYARGKISSSTSLAGLFIGNIANHEDVNAVSGYFSGTTSNFGSVASIEATGINGNSVTISEVTNSNYAAKFEDFVFGDEVGQWSWEGNGKWPALNIGGTAPTADQPIAASSYTPYIPGAQEEQTDKSLEGIERLKDNVFKVYETHSWISEQKRIENKIPQTDFFPTGLYVKPNQAITVTVASDTAPKNLKVFTGTYSRYEGENWDPDTFTIKVGKNTITNTRNKPRLIYIQFVDRRPFDVATITIDGATKLPYFIRGKTTSKEFQSMLKNYDYDSVLVASDRIMMVVSKETALQVQNQDWAKTAELLDKVVERAEYIHGLDSETYYDTPPTTRILASEREGGGPMSATNYRISAPKGSAIGWIDNSKIIKDWGLWHETGHMYEPRQILIGETNVNIYSLAIERGFKQESRLVRDGTWNKITAYLAKPAAEKKFNDLNVFIKLGMFQQLWLGYGSTDEARDKFFINLNKKIRKESKNIRAKSDESLAYLMLKSSEVYGYNLNEFFKNWGFQVPQSAFDAVDELGLEDPPVDPSTLVE